MYLHQPARAAFTPRADRRPKYVAARAFYIAILVISIIAALSSVSQRGQWHALSRSDTRLVHRRDLIFEDAHSQLAIGPEEALTRRDEAVRHESN